MTSTATTTTSTLENTEIPTTHESLTPSASELQIVTTTTLVSSSTEVIPITDEAQSKATDTVTIISDKVSSTQQIPGKLCGRLLLFVVVCCYGDTVCYL